MKPTIGRIVLYRSRTGDYDVPAIVTATIDTLNPKGVELGRIPGLSGTNHVHLTCFTAGKPGMRQDAEDFKVESKHGRSENVSGCYQEWDIPFWEGPTRDLPEGERIGPGTWRWPGREGLMRVGQSIDVIAELDKVLEKEEEGAPIKHPTLADIDRRLASYREEIADAHEVLDRMGIAREGHGTRLPLPARLNLLPDGTDAEPEKCEDTCVDPTPAEDVVIDVRFVIQGIA